MNTDYAAIALIVDRSGSMQSIASDVKGGVQKFIGDQKTKNGKASLTVVQFDHEYEVVYNFKDIQDVKEDLFAEQYAPRGLTALLDAIGRTTIALSQKLDSMPEAERPKRVVVAVITDGLENASQEFNIAKIKELIKQKEALGWDFIFLGATLDTIDVAKNYGFSETKTAVYSTSKFEDGMLLISEKTTQARLGQKVAIQKEERDNLVNSFKPPSKL